MIDTLRGPSGTMSLTRTHPPSAQTSDRSGGPATDSDADVPDLVPNGPSSVAGDGMLCGLRSGTGTIDTRNGFGF